MLTPDSESRYRFRYETDSDVETDSGYRNRFLDVEIRLDTKLILTLTMIQLKPTQRNRFPDVETDPEVERDWFKCRRWPVMSIPTGCWDRFDARRWPQMRTRFGWCRFRMLIQTRRWNRLGRWNRFWCRHWSTQITDSDVETDLWSWRWLETLTLGFGWTLPDKLRLMTFDSDTILQLDTDSHGRLWSDAETDWCWNWLDADSDSDAETDSEADSDSQIVKTESKHLTPILTLKLKYCWIKAESDSLIQIKRLLFLTLRSLPKLR